MCGYLLSLILLILVCTPLYAQEGDTTNDADPQSVALSDEQNDEDSQRSDSKEEQTIFRDLDQETLPQDIQSLNFFQLVAWVERLGLSTQGDRRQLQLRLYEYYEIDINVHPLDGEDGSEDKTAIIESAFIGDYFSSAESDEDYVRLQGGVRIQFTDTDENTTHTIEAQELIFNQSENFVTARGDVQYTIQRDSGSEEFFGDTLTFQIDDWDGYFIRGGGITQPESESATRFRYEADFISRSKDDVVVMEDVAITTSPALDPYYRIEASRVWIVGEGEWGMQDAIILFPLFLPSGR